MYPECPKITGAMLQNVLEKRVYQNLIISDMEEKNIDANEAVLNVFTSFISDKISDFNTSTFYSSPDYLRCSYNAGVLLM